VSRSYKIKSLLRASLTAHFPCYALREHCEPRMATKRTVLIKRYARSRLYRAAKRRYVSVQELRQWQGEGIWFVVEDAEGSARR